MPSTPQAGLHELLARGLNAYEEGDFGTALGHWFKVLKEDPGNRRAETYLSYVRRLRPKLYQQAEREHLIEEHEPGQRESEPATGTDTLHRVRRKLREARVTGLPTFTRWQKATDIRDGWERPNIGGTASSLEELERRMREYDQLDDCSALLEVADTILRGHPEHSDAQRARVRAEDVLSSRYLAALGGPDTVVGRVMTDDGIIWQDLDAAAAFVLGMVDGVATVEDIAAASGLRRVRALQLIVLLQDRGVVRLLPAGS